MKIVHIGNIYPLCSKKRKAKIGGLREDLSYSEYVNLPKMFSNMYGEKPFRICKQCLKRITNK